MIIVTSYEINHEDCNVICSVSDTNRWSGYSETVSFAALRDYVMKEYGVLLQMYLQHEDHVTMCIDLACVVRTRKAWAVMGQ